MQNYFPTLKQMQYLVALHEHGHFGRAADACNVTQSTLSAGIRELETLLGQTLVERTRRVVRFTGLGNAIVEKAHRVLREAEELADMAAAAAAPLVGELRMSVIPTIAPFLLPGMLRLLRKERPALKLFLREEPSAQACESLHHGTVDCVLLALPYGCGDVESEELFDDALFVAFPGDQSEDLPAMVSADQLDPAQMLMLEDGHCLKDHALAACNRPELRAGGADDGDVAAHAGPDGGQWPGHHECCRQMAIEAGILDHTDIDTRPLDSDHDWRTIALVWRKGSPRADEFKMLADIFRKHRAG